MSSPSTPASATNASTSTASGPWPRPAWSSPTGNTITTTTVDTHRWVTNHQPATLPPVPTNERLSFAVDQFTGSGHPYHAHHRGVLLGAEAARRGPPSQLFLRHTSILGSTVTSHRDAQGDLL